MNERLPALPPVHSQQAYSTGTGSPPGSSIGSGTSSHAGSHSSYTSAASSLGPKTPPTPSSQEHPSIPGPASTVGAYDHYPAMNQGPGDPNMYYQQQSQMPGGQAPPVTSGPMGHYSHQQPPVLHPGPAQYSAAPAYNQYGYANGLTSPPQAPGSGGMGQQHVLPLPGQPGMQNQYSGLDTTGQVAPPGMKPRVTATLWEDEGSLCFQVEARGICVARREDNHMINGTKLLNVAGMTRGRRDGILKSEKVRHVVKIGPMHLKGVWIPFERALDFANKEKITELLYPLFVHNIGALLYHPTNQNRTTQVMAAAERRKQEANQMRGSQQSPAGLPSLQHHHHHSMSLPGPQQQQPPLPSHQGLGGQRPSLDRAHTFPTPPASAGGAVMGNIGGAENFQWSQQGMSGAQGTNPMSIDTGLSNARSLPATPATTPPGPNLQSMSQYPPATQAYDNARQPYNAPPLQQQSPYAPSNTSPQDRSLYGQNNYVKSEMGPPSGRPSVGGPAADQPDSKPSNGYAGHNGEHVSHAGQDDEAEHDHEAEYTHDRGNYDQNSAPYSYNAPPLAPLQNDHPHMSPEMAGSAGQQGASGRSTPRSAAHPQAYYPSQGYNTPPRTQQQSSTLYNLMSNDRGQTNGASNGDVYAPQPDMNNSMQNGYGAPILNGAPSGGMKRGRDDDDDRPSSGGAGMGGIDKRRKLTLESVPAPVYQQPPTVTATSQRRR